MSPLSLSRARLYANTLLISGLWRELSAGEQTNPDKGDVICWPDGIHTTVENRETYSGPEGLPVLRPIKPLGKSIMPNLILTGEDLIVEQMRRNRRRERRKTFNDHSAGTAKCLCACGLRFTTKGIKQHQRRCAVQQAAWKH